MQCCKDFQIHRWKQRTNVLKRWVPLWSKRSAGFYFPPWSSSEGNSSPVRWQLGPGRRVELGRFSSWGQQPGHAGAPAVLRVNSTKLAVHGAAFPHFWEDQSCWIESQLSADKRVTGLVYTYLLLVIHHVTDSSGLPSLYSYTWDTHGHIFSL